MVADDGNERFIETWYEEHVGRRRR